MTTTSTWKSNWVREMVTGLVNWARTFSVEAYPACASSKICEFIETFPNLFSVINTIRDFVRARSVVDAACKRLSEGAKWSVAVQWTAPPVVGHDPFNPDNFRVAENNLQKWTTGMDYKEIISNKNVFLQYTQRYNKPASSACQTFRLINVDGNSFASTKLLVENITSYRRLIFLMLTSTPGPDL